MAANKKRRPKRQSRSISDLKNINLLREEIEDEMTWLEQTFLRLKTPWVTIWGNTHAEERYKILEQRRDTFLKQEK